MDIIQNFNEMLLTSMVSTKAFLRNDGMTQKMTFYENIKIDGLVKSQRQQTLRSLR
jgi:hypothetical protein